MSITTIWQTCPSDSPERQRATTRSWDSLERSDLDRIVRAENPPNLSRWAFFGRVLETMSDVDTEYVLRVEDDTIVNRHTAHNFMAWSARKDPLFGAGWLFVPKAVWSDQAKLGKTKLGRYRNYPGMWAALAVVMPVNMARLCLEAYQLTSVSWGQDLLMSHTVLKSGKRVFLHEPSLAQNLDPPSMRIARSTSTGKAEDQTKWERRRRTGIGNAHHFAGDFDPSWRRRC